ncbi:MAG: four helix bundle protein [Microgenomates group bacterium]
MSKKRKIEEFTDLIVWQEGHKLVPLIYKITKNFPKEETYLLIDQICRTAVSITSNIAEYC